MPTCIVTVTEAQSVATNESGNRPNSLKFKESARDKQPKSVEGNDPGIQRSSSEFSGADAYNRRFSGTQNSSEIQNSMVAHKSIAEPDVTLMWQKVSCPSARNHEKGIDDCLEGTSSKSALGSLLVEGFPVETPVLTNVTTRNASAIIKIDKEAISQCRKLIHEVEQVDTDGKLSHLKFATTDLFFLEIRSCTGQVTQVGVRFKVFLNGCSGQEGGKFVSVFVEISNAEGKKLDCPFVVTLFLKNLQDENGNSFRKSIKLVPDGSKVERGIRDFVSIEQFDKLVNEGSLVNFGLLIRQ